jgi:16S rRNA pseudouridine516 synthase
MPTQTLVQILHSQGFGVRRACEGLILGGHLRIDGQTLTDPEARIDPQGLSFEVEGRPWLYQDKALILLHKPAGYECSQKASAWPSIMLLLPPPLRHRGVQSVGRLDQDTTGALLLTDDGPLLHKLTSPKHHVPKVYEVTAARPIEDRQITRLLAGVVLDDDPRPVAAQACERTDELHLRLTLTQGKYHQVKRMMAAVGNHCERLHRSTIGNLVLDGGDLPEGQWRFVTDTERAALTAKR